MWNEAFKWSSKYHTTDPDKKPDIKPLSKEDFEFLEQAFEQVMLNETKEFLKHLEKLENTPENADCPEDEKFRLELIEKMDFCTNGLEVSRNICRSKKFKNVMGLFFYSKNLTVKVQLCRLIALMMQNDIEVQKHALENGILEVVNFLKEDTVEKELIQKIIYLLSGLIYGECEESRLSFVKDFDGFEILKNVYQKYEIFRILRIFQDLTKPEDNVKLHKTSMIMKENFVKKNLDSFILEILEKDFNNFHNTDDDDIKSTIYNILINISSMWNEDQYETYNQFYKKILNKTLVDKSITDPQIKDLIRTSNEQIKNNYKNKKTYIPDSGDFLEELNIIGVLNKDKSKTDTSGNDVKILALDSN